MYAILILLLAVLILLRLTKVKGKFGVFQLIACLIVIGLLAGGIGMLSEKGWGKTLSNISLGAFILFILLPALGRLLGVAIFTKMFYEGMDEKEKEKD